MDIDKYQGFSAHLKSLAKDEREQFVVDKKVITTAAAVIDELLFKILTARTALTTDKIIIDSLRMGESDSTSTLNNKLVT